MKNKEKKGKQPRTASIITQWFYDQLNPKLISEIESRKTYTQTRNENNIRVQCYIPKTTYISLAALGAFQVSESEFFTTISAAELDKRIMALKPKGLFKEE